MPRDEPLIRERLWVHDPELAPEVTARTEYDDAGRPVRTVYSGVEYGSEQLEERYGYDAGRVVTIDEVGPEQELVWEHLEEPWPELLASSAHTVADRVIALVAARCREAAIPPATEVFGLEEDRRAWLRAGLDRDELASRLWYLDDSWFGEGEGGGLSHLEDDLPGDDLHVRLLMYAAIEQPGDPYRVVLNAIAAELARRDWSDLMTPTDEFVVFIAVRAANPPERVAAWDAGWPPGVSRGEDEPAWPA